MVGFLIIIIILLSNFKVEEYDFFLLHSVLSGGESPGCVKESWGVWSMFREILAKIPGIYQIPKLRNMIFFVDAECAFWVCGGNQRREDCGLKVLMKIHTLYQFAKLRNRFFLIQKIGTDKLTDFVLN